MVGKDKERITISLNKEVIEILDILGKTGNKTRSQVITDGVALIFAVARGLATIKYSKEEGEVHNA